MNNLKGFIKAYMCKIWHGKNTRNKENLPRKNYHLYKFHKDQEKEGEKSINFL